MSRFIFALFSVLFICVIAGEAIGEDSPASNAGPRLQVGDEYEPFGLKRLIPDKEKNRFVYLDSFVGKRAKTPAKVVIISFFASWCKACKSEIPHIQELYKRYADKGLMVLVVNIDNEKDGIQAAEKYFKRQKLPFPVLSDRLNIVARRYFNKEFSLPANFLISADGKVAAVFSQGDAVTLEKLETKSRSLLGLGSSEAKAEINK